MNKVDLINRRHIDAVEEHLRRPLKGGGGGLGVNTRLLWTELIGQRMFASVDSIMNNLFEMIKLVVQMYV
jgi:hypothetical protein